MASDFAGDQYFCMIFTFKTEILLLKFKKHNFLPYNFKKTQVKLLWTEK